ncbi:MAG TPA: DegV family protein, partial [Solirubrobacteraceae bacterium]|nr:DegV family protein [Solirubrobacteraceae bacterium]
MTVTIVTDSAAALPADLVERHRITVVPMWLTIGGESVREGERPLSELLGDERVSTSGPAPGEFEEAIASRLDD